MKKTNLFACAMTLLALSTSVSPFIAPAFAAGNKFDEIQAANPGATPYVLLEKLFLESSKAADFSDFDGKTCVWAMADSMAPRNASFSAQSNYLVARGNPGTPSQGPLFPGTPSTPDQYATAVRISLNMHVANIDADIDLGPADLTQFIVSHTAQDLVETLNMDDAGLKNTSIEIDARKSDNLIAMHLVLQNVPIYVYATKKSYSQNYDAYAYCY